MIKFFETENGVLYQGDSIAVLKTLPENSVHCCVTSPPYWGLRSYKTESQIWGGATECPHEWECTPPRRQRKEADIQDAGSKQATNAASVFNSVEVSGSRCRKCGAWRGELGLEPTPGMFVEHLTAVFREVRRGLRHDGTLWLNIGDTYADKNLCMVPARVAIALQSDGWYLRSEIIWAKPNPMPESVKDRPTKSHEMIYLLSKTSEYYYDYKSVKEPVINPERINFQSGDRTNGINNDRNDNDFGVRSKGVRYSNRNLRDVWTVATHPFSEAHFATFPEKLIEPMIKAGCPTGGTVLDPFGGSGTVAAVCENFDRRWILAELNPEYCNIAERRIRRAAQRHKQLCFESLEN